jgi:hypothetical protein
MMYMIRAAVTRFIKRNIAMEQSIWLNFRETTEVRDYLVSEMPYKGALLEDWSESLDGMAIVESVERLEILPTIQGQKRWRVRISAQHP